MLRFQEEEEEEEEEEDTPQRRKSNIETHPSIVHAASDSRDVSFNLHDILCDWNVARTNKAAGLKSPDCCCLRARL